MEGFTGSSRARKTKKKGFFAAYFDNFGLRQTTGLLMLVSAITLIFGLIFQSEITLIVGLAVYVGAAVLGIINTIMVLVRTHPKSPEHKRAFVNIFVMSAIIIVAVAGLIYCIVNGIYST